jgi:hypothetical protein
VPPITIDVQNQVVEDDESVMYASFAKESNAFEAKESNALDTFQIPSTMEDYDMLLTE